MARKKKPSIPVLDTALAIVMVGGTPDLGRDETLGTVKIVDPFELSAWHDVGGARPQARIKVVSLRDDPLGRLYARGQIDEAQYNAGRRWQAVFAAAEIGNIRAVDTTRDVVDGGKMVDAFSDRMQKAIKDLKGFDRALGAHGSALVRLILGERLFVHQVAERQGQAGERATRYLGLRFRECLETLARKMDLA